MYLLFDHPKSILEPSNGGIGKRLKMANNTLKNIIFKKNIAKTPLTIFDGINSDIFNIIADKMANKKFAMTPADATKK